MNHSQLIHKLAKRLALNKEETTHLLSSFITLIAEQLEQGNSVSLPDIGTFEVIRRKERVSVQPNSGKRFLVPPKLVLKLKPIQSLKDKLRKISADE